MQEFDTETLLSQYQDAVALANRAKLVLENGKSLSSQRAKDALKVWDTATQNAIRLQRNLRLAGAAPKSLDDELSDLLSPQ